MALETPDDIAQWREDRKRKWPRLLSQQPESGATSTSAIETPEDIAQWREDRRRKWPRVAIDTRESGPEESKKRAITGSPMLSKNDLDGGNMSSQQPEPGATSTSAIEVFDSKEEDGDQCFQIVEDDRSADKDSSENNRRDRHVVDNDEIRYEDDTDIEDGDIIKNDDKGEAESTVNIQKIPQTDYHPRYSPYADRLSQFKPNLWQLEKKLPVKSPVLETTKLTIVDTEPVLLEMLSALKLTVELAIDFRRGSERNNDKHRVVIQISSRTEDFLVDCQQLQKQQMMLLNEVFANPSIMKVVNFNGSDGIFMLARYCGIYIVNAFNVRVAEKHLKIVNSNPIYGVRRRLGSILKEQCDITISLVPYDVIPEEGIQLSEASEEMLTTLREDSHYLLHLHDVYRNKLIFMNSLAKVYEESTLICRGEADELQADTYKKNIKQTKLRQLNVQEHECYRLVHDWAWMAAKRNEKRLDAIMGKKTMELISKTMPRTLEDLQKCYMGDIPKLVKDSSYIVFKLVAKAIDKFPDPKPSNKEGVTAKKGKKN